MANREQARQLATSTPQAQESSQIVFEPLMEVLVSKLQAPRLHPSLISRPHLLQQLESGLFGKLTLVSAPAGFGKTTLVSQWMVDHSHTSLAWLSLDSAENDPMQFWHYLITACQVFLPDRSSSALALLHSSPDAPLQRVIRMFLNELACLPKRGILVLEDYHVIRSAEIHASLTFLLEHLPAQFHLILITRNVPPLPLARLRAHGLLSELHGKELCFSEEETTSLLHQTLPGVLSDGEAHMLASRLEGWVTGLRLALLVLQRCSSQSEIEHFLITFSGDQHQLFAFFVCEVLATQPEPLQRFLLQTSLLTRFCASLCDCMMEVQGSEQMLRAVEDANLFLSSLDGVGRWYRYHPLFAEAMRHEARQRWGEEALRVCFSRVSRWYEQEGLFSEAVEMALQAQDFQRAATLIEQSLRPHHTYHDLKEYSTLRRWLDSVPEKVLGQHPRLCARLVLLLMFSRTGDGLPVLLKQIEWLLQQAEYTWRAEGNRSGLGEVTLLRALLSWEQGDLAQAAHFARDALALLPGHETQWRASCLRIIGEEALHAGRMHEASQLLLEALAYFDAAGNSSGALAVRLTLAEVYRLQGALRQAAELYRLVQSGGTEDRSKRGQAQLGLARLSYAWNALDVAEQEAQEALDVGTQLADEVLQIEASFVLASIEQAHGQIAAAQQRLHALLASRLGVLAHTPLLHRHLLTAQARLALAVGDLVTVERWVTNCTEQKKTLSLLQQEQEALIALRLLIARGETDKPIRRLRSWQALAHQQGRLHSEIEILVLRALAFSVKENRPRAHTLLRQALGHAQMEGEIRLFLDEGEAMALMLRTALPAMDMDLAETYVQTLLSALTQQSLQQKAADPSSIPASSPAIGLLSSQERRVLGLLMAGYSNSEVARTLVVSINTVKTQVRSIYQKLNVKSRKEMRQIVRG